MGKAKTKKIMLTFMLVLTFLISLLIFPSMFSISRASPDGTVVKVVPASQTVGSMTEPLPTSFSINVTVENVADLYNWQVRIKFTPESIEAINASVPSDNIFAGKSALGLQVYIDNTAGYIECGNTLLGEPSGVAGSGVLCTINFKGLKSGTFNLNFSRPLGEDTFLQDSDLRDISFTVEDGSVTIQGEEVERDPSTITIQVSTTKAYLGQKIRINGSITPTPVEPNNTDVSLYYVYGISLPVKMGTAKTQNGNYEYEWDTFTLESIFALQNKAVLNFTVWAEWAGDSKYLGNKSQEVTITIMKPNTILKIDYANNTHPWIGDENIFVTAAAPCTFNVTVFNVTNLVSWHVKIYYPDDFVYFDVAWIPENNVFGENYTAGPVEIGTDEEGAYITFNASTTGAPASAFNTTALLFQLNLSAKFPTTILGMSPPIYFSSAETALKNSTGQKIPAILEECYVVVKGITSELKVINPKATDESKKHIFDFSVVDTSVGYKFNVTIQIFNVFNLFAWKVKLTYNSTLLKAVRGWFPSWNETTDVLYGRQVNNTLTSIEINNAEAIVNMTCFLKQGEQKFTGNGTLAIIEFEILIAPKPASFYSCELDIAHEGETALSSDGEKWYNPTVSNGMYSFYGKGVAGGGEEGTDWESYIILGVLVAIPVVLVVLYWRKKRKFAREYEEEAYEEQA